MKKIKGTEEAWESGELGCDEAHVKTSKLNEDQIDEALGLKAISIRLQKSLIDDLKLIADINGLGYQPLIKQVLRRYVNAEIRIILQQEAQRRAKEIELGEEEKSQVQCA